MKKRLVTILLALTLSLAIALPALAVDDYPSKYRDVPKDSVTDEWRFYNRECVSFVAWCLSSRNGIAFSNYESGLWWGNANNWDDTARALGYPVNSTPAIGAVAYWDNGYYGHVAWVSAVNGNNVTVEEYNYDYDGGYHERTIPSSEPYGYIHIRDLSSWGGASAAQPDPEPEVTFTLWQDDDYTFVGETDAALGQRIVVEGGKCNDIGLYLCDKDGGYLTEAGSAYTAARVLFIISEDCGYELTPGTDYTYKFYAVVDGKTYWSEEGSFTTAGQAPTPVKSAPAPGMGEDQGAEVHFPVVNSYSKGQFKDVKANDWFDSWVGACYELGLIKGVSDASFDPKGEVTIAQAVTMACRLHSIYTKGTDEIETVSGPWYQTYMDYAYKNGIINSAYYFCDPTEAANRAQFAEIFADALPAEALTAINDLEDGAVPDVEADASFSKYVYLLYRAGIIQGSDSKGTFNPGSNITRAEAAAILARMAESDNRLEFEL